MAPEIGVTDTILYQNRFWLVNGIFNRYSDWVAMAITYEPRFQAFWNDIQWNLSVTATSKIKIITCDLFSNVF